VADRTDYIATISSDFRSRIESDFPRWPQFQTRYGDAVISNATNNARIGHEIRRTWIITAGKNFAIKISANPLQIETWLLLTDSLQKLVIALYNGAITDPQRRTV